MVAKVLTNFHDKYLPANLESFACFDFLKNGIGCTLDTSIKRNRYPKLIITNRSTGQCLKNSPQLSRVFHDAIHHRWLLLPVTRFGELFLNQYFIVKL